MDALVQARLQELVGSSGLQALQQGFSGKQFALLTPEEGELLTRFRSLTADRDGLRTEVLRLEGLLDEARKQLKPLEAAVVSFGSPPPSSPVATQ